MQISIRQLGKRYSRGRYALQEIDLEIGSGMFGLLGPNGAGKTTLMRILVTLLEPTSGQVRIDGLDLRRDRTRIRRLIGYLPQDFADFPRLSVWEFLDYVAALSGLRRRSARRDRVDRRLEEVGLFDARDRLASRLSGGMKRRLGIAQTLIGDPAVVVVDEPTVGLDPQERLRFRNLLADLAQRDIVILLSTHIVGDISSTCTGLALLNQGRIVFTGSPDALVATARDSVWKITASHDQLDRLRERYPVISTVPAAQGYEVRLVADAPPDGSAVPLVPNLEDAYIHFMRQFGQEMDLEPAADRVRGGP